MRAALRVRDRIQTTHLEGIIAPALKELAEKGGSEALIVEIISEFRLASLQELLTALAIDENLETVIRSSAVSALGRIDAGDAPALLAIIESPSTNPGLRRSAIATVGASGKESATTVAIQAITELSPPVREGVYEDLAGSANGAELILLGIASRAFEVSELSLAVLEKMRTLLPDAPRMEALWESAAEKLPRALVLLRGC